MGVKVTDNRKVRVFAKVDYARLKTEARKKGIEKKAFPRTADAFKQKNGLFFVRQHEIKVNAFGVTFTPKYAIKVHVFENEIVLQGCGDFEKNGCNMKLEGTIKPYNGGVLADLESTVVVDVHPVYKMFIGAAHQKIVKDMMIKFFNKYGAGMPKQKPLIGGGV